jgi:hypothetical protein
MTSEDVTGLLIYAASETCKECPTVEDSLRLLAGAGQFSAILYIHAIEAVRKHADTTPYEARTQGYQNALEAFRACVEHHVASLEGFERLAAMRCVACGSRGDEPHGAACPAGGRL